MAMHVTSLTELELSVMRAIARVDHERIVMERQIEALRPLRREHTGVGFYTFLEVPDGVERLDAGRWRIEDMGHAFAHHPDLPAGASFILAISGGKLVQLEGYTNEGAWPLDESM
jgi:hypothetical protein